MNKLDLSQDLSLFRRWTRGKAFKQFVLILIAVALLVGCNSSASRSGRLSNCSGDFRRIIEAVDRYVERHGDLPRDVRGVVSVRTVLDDDRTTLSIDDFTVGKAGGLVPIAMDDLDYVFFSSTLSVEQFERLDGTTYLLGISKPTLFPVSPGLESVVLLTTVGPETVFRVDSARLQAWLHDARLRSAPIPVKTANGVIPLPFEPAQE